MQQFYKTDRETFFKVWRVIKKEVEAVKSNWKTFKKDGVPLVIVWGYIEHTKIEGAKTGDAHQSFSNVSEIIAFDISLGELDGIWVSLDYYPLTGNPIPAGNIGSTYKTFLDFCSVKLSINEARA